MKRNLFLDFSKGVLILLVVIGHTVQYGVHQGTGYWDDPLFKAIYMFHMPLFMALSGYLAYAGMESAKPVDYLIKKAHAYIIPIMVWSIFTATILIINSYRHLSFDYLINVIQAAVGGLWFLWALFGSLVITILAKATRRYFAFTYLLAPLLVFMLPEVGEVYMFKYTFPFFQVGFVVALYGVPVFIEKGRKLIILFSGIVSVVCFQLWDKNVYVYISKSVLESGNYQNLILRYLAGLVVSLFVLLVLDYLCSIAHESVRRLISSIGRSSMRIYIIQGYAFIVIAHVARIWLPPVSNIGVGAFLGVSCGLCVALVCWLIGNVLAKNCLAARLLFGIVKKTDQAIQAAPLALRQKGGDLTPSIGEPTS